MTFVLPGESAFRLKDTHGVPMSILVDHVAEQGGAIDVRGFIRAALTAGWTVKTICRAFEEAQDAITKEPVWMITEKV